MGMFDYVKYKKPCFKCGEMLTNWQSKDGRCLMEDLTTDDVDNFYTECNCGAWNEYKRTGEFTRVEDKE